MLGDQGRSMQKDLETGGTVAVVLFFFITFPEH